MLAATPRWATLPTLRPFHRGLYRRICASTVPPRGDNLSLWTSLATLPARHTLWSTRLTLPALRISSRRSHRSWERPPLPTASGSKSGSDGSSARGSKRGSNRGSGGSARWSKSGSKSGSGGGSSIGSRGERIAGLLGLGSVFIQVLGQQPYRSGHLERCVLDGRRGHRRGQRGVASRGLRGMLVAGGRFLRGCVLRPCI
jgi:hypothetical protein